MAGHFVIGHNTQCLCRSESEVNISVCSGWKIIPNIGVIESKKKQDWRDFNP